MTALVLVNELRQQGVRFIANDGRLRVLVPKGLTLPESVRAEIMRQGAEIMRRLHSGGVAAKDMTEAFPGAMEVEPEQETPAAAWLRSKLTPGPRHIAELIAEWVGPLANPTGRDLDALMEARWVLKVEPFISSDERFWWRLLQETIQ